MVGVPVGGNPTSLTEIAEACHDYSKPNNLMSFRNVYMTDNTRSGNGTSTALKYSQFTGKNVAYNVTSTGLLASGVWDQTFASWSSFAASRGLEYFMLSSVNNTYNRPRAFDTSGTLHADLQYQGTTNSTFYIKYHGYSLAIDRTGIMVVGYDQHGSSVPGGANALYLYKNSSYFSSATWTPIYDWQYGFGKKLGHLANSDGYVYVPTSGPAFTSGRTVTILKIEITNSMLISNWYYGDSYFFGHSNQISENLDRFVIDQGPGSYVQVYRITGESDRAFETSLTTTGGTGHVYCNSDCSVVVSGNNIWHRSGTTWTAANTDEIANRNVDARTCDISDDGTIVVYKRDGLSSDPGGADQLNHFHYHKTNNKWYYTGTSNLGTTGENNRFLGGGFLSTNIGVRNDGLVIGKWDAGTYAPPNAKPKAYKGIIGVK